MRFEDELRARCAVVVLSETEDRRAGELDDVVISVEERDALADAVEALRAVIHVQFSSNPNDYPPVMEKANEALARLDGVA